MRAEGVTISQLLGSGDALDASLATTNGKKHKPGALRQEEALQESPAAAKVPALTEEGDQGLIAPSHSNRKNGKPRTQEIPIGAVAAIRPPQEEQPEEGPADGNLTVVEKVFGRSMGWASGDVTPGASERPRGRSSKRGPPGVTA